MYADDFIDPPPPDEAPDWKTSESLLGIVLLPLDAHGLWDRGAGDLNAAGEVAALDAEHPMHEIACSWIVARDYGKEPAAVLDRARVWVSEHAR